MAVFERSSSREVSLVSICLLVDVLVLVLELDETTDDEVLVVDGVVVVVDDDDNGTPNVGI